MKSSSRRRPTVLDLFAGAGGLSLGFEEAGFDVVGAIEIDPIHCSVHAFNFPHCEVLCSDITKLKGEDITAKIPKKIDVVVGGAPCQGFSLIGQRALDDPRNQLVLHFMRIVVELQPEYFVLENVKGLTMGKHKMFLDELQEEFEKHDYEVVKPWRVLNAKNFGVPQDRQRLFLLGVKRGNKLPVYPVASSATVTCQDAISDLPDIERFSTLLTSDTVRHRLRGKPSDYAREMRKMTPTDWHYGYQRQWDEEMLTASMRTTHSDISMRRFAETAPGKTEPISRFFRLPPHGVSNTLRAGTDSARGAFTSPRPIHYRYPRCISVREMARLHGFPDWFRLHSTKWHGARQVGNAVPPPLARAVASSIIAAMGIQPARPKMSLELGSVELLYSDMRSAAEYWQVLTPIGRRDKKSGAKKRKQEEIEASRASGPEHAKRA